ncbi:hypothetical protein F5884DRAFT_775271 [Xylogone sp. PMI_703]|nr:hypothetical protein F5884DRAFT_775271 [Xylogone sp. PMI_703]
MGRSSSSQELPKNWPSGVSYITAPILSKSLTSSHIEQLRSPGKDCIKGPQNIPRGPCSLVRITPISSPTHPACGQCGLFATRDLKPGTFILRYLGEIHPSSNGADESKGMSVEVSDVDRHAESDYDLSLDRELGLGIDADKMGNEARFVNDYRGIADKPNVEFKEIWDEVKKERGMGVWVLAEGKSGKGKGVKKGEELLVSYGRGFWAARR